MNKISVNSATQLNKILSFLSEDIRKKIPEDILNEIAKKTNNNLDTKINKVKDINLDNILPETRKYLSFIFINYLATEEEKIEYTKIIKNNQQQYEKFLNEKYSVEKIFNKRKNLINENKQSIEQTNNLPIEYKNNIFKFIFNKLKSLFKK